MSCCGTAISRALFKAAFWIPVFLISACLGITPHENFKNALNAMIGYRIDEIQPGWARAGDFVSKSTLPNGHLEYWYKETSCSYFFEVDPLTKKILGARFEGRDEDCVIFP